MRYKIKKFRDGYKVWAFESFGCGRAWVDIDRFFRTRAAAEQYILEKKREERNDKSR